MKLPPTLSGVLLALLLTVCSSAASAITFYSETRDTQAQAVKDAWAKVDLKAVIEGPRANLSNLLTQQLAAVADSGAARQTALVQLISLSNARQVGSEGSNPTTLFGQLDILLDRSALVSCGSPVDDKRCVAKSQGRAAWRQLLSEVAKAQAQLDALKVRRQRVAKPAYCAEPGDDSELRTKCAVVAQANKNLEDFNPSAAWVEAQKTADAANQQLADAQKQADDLKDKIADELKTASDSAGSRDKQVVAKVAAAAASLKGNLETLLSLQNNDVFHYELLSQIKQDALNAFLSTLADAKDGTPPPATSPKAAMAVVLFPQFFDDTTSELKQTADAGIAPIVLQKEVSRLQQESATADINARKARVALLQQRAKVLRDQFDLIVQAEEARGALTAATSQALVEEALLGATSKAGTCAVQGAPLIEAATKGGVDVERPSRGVDDDQRLALWLSLGNYLRADAAQASAAAIDLKLAATDRVAELAYTEANINAWNSLIDAHVNQLVTWSKAGIKGSDITATLQTLAAWWIAYGVNK